MKRVVLVLAAFLTLTAVMPAASISYSNAFPLSGEVATDWTFPSMMLPQFNPALGTLTSIVMDWGGAGTMHSTATNVSATPQTFDLDVNIRLRLTRPNSTGGGTTNLDVNLVAYSLSGVFLPAFGALDLGTVTPSDSAIFNIPVGANYIGTGNIAVPIRADVTTTFVGGGGNITLTGTATARGDAMITYNYTEGPAIPEPATMGLMGSALLGFGLLRFRRKA